MRKYFFLIPIAVAIAIHFPVLLCGFVWDDTTLIETNTSLGSTSVVEFFSQDYGQHLGQRAPVGYYRPTFVALISLAYRIAGPSTFLFHSISLVLFCIATLLVSLLACAILGKEKQLLAIIAGSLYAAHAGRTEVVAFVMSMPDLIVDICSLSIILLLLKNAATRSQVWLKALAVAALALIALTTKESAFFTMAGIAGCIILRLMMTRKRSIQLWTACAGMAIAAGAGLFLNHAAGIVRQPITEYLRALFSTGSGGALNAAAVSIRDILIPSHPVFMESLTTHSSAATILLVLALSAALIAGAIHLSRRSLPGGMLFGWFAAGLISVMLIGAVGIPYSQRYIPLAPAIIGLVMILARFPKLIAHRALTLTAILYISFHGAFALGGSIKCRDNITFFTFMADEHPDLIYPRVYLVDRLFHEHRNYALMAAHAYAGLTIDPNSAQSVTLRKFLARKLLIEGDPSAARSVLNEASITLYTKHPSLGDDAELFWLQAISLLETGDKARALSLLEKAVSIDPSNVEYLATLKSVKPKVTD